jgi:hypothetical protein
MTPFNQYREAAIFGRELMCDDSSQKIIVEAPFDAKIMSDVIRSRGFDTKVIPVERYAFLNDIPLQRTMPNGRPNFRNTVISVTENSELCWGLIDRDSGRGRLHSRLVRTDARDIESTMFSIGLDRFVQQVITNLCRFEVHQSQEFMRCCDSFVEFYWNLVKAFDYIVNSHGFDVEYLRTFYLVADSKSLALLLTHKNTVNSLILHLVAEFELKISMTDFERYQLRIKSVNGHILVNVLALAIVADTRIHHYLSNNNRVRDVMHITEVHDMYHRVNASLVELSSFLLEAEFVNELIEKIRS